MDAIRVTKVERVAFTKTGTTSIGTIHLTAHHIIFRYDDGKEKEIWVPYPLISLVTRLPQTLQGQSPINFNTRTFETFSFTFTKDSDASDVFESVKELTVSTSVTQLYAFFYSPSPPFSTSDGWSLYSPRDEFGRMGVGTRTKAWRFTDINKDYSFSATYPARLVIPTRISDTTLQYASKYRSKCRIPVLSYLHWANYGTITRSSQPMVGITQNRSVQDEKLIEAVFQSHWSPESRASNTPVYGATSTNLIIDARPTVNAVANSAKGAGTENMDHYKDSKKVYLGIDHIHTMRESLAKVVEALRDADSLLATINNDLPEQLPTLAVLDRQALRRSGWLRHIAAILEGTLLITRNVHVNSSHVLVHCSDGWDRTSQLSALAQLCLDPFYRTIRGFEILIEKDWLSFGHKFLDRCGHLSSEKFFLSPTEGVSSGAGADAAQAFLASVQNRFASQTHIKETSPVFHQFLESVRQVQRQFPNRFEFNERFLHQLYYHLYSCQFGTFLYNCERERRVGDGGPPPCERTISVWDYFNSPTEMAENKNPAYDPSLDDPMARGPGADMGVLFVNPKDVRFWHELYGRTDEEMNGRAALAIPRAPDALGSESTDDEPAISRSQTPTIPLSSSPSSSSATPLNLSQSLNVQRPRPRSTSPNLGSDSQDVSLSGVSTSPSRDIPSSNTHKALVRPRISSSTSASSQSAPIWARTKPPDFLLSGGGVKSVWGKLSSNATAAFSVVQDAYTSVAKDLRNNGGEEPSEGSSELKGRDTLSAWGEETSVSPLTQGPNSLASLTLGNPWATTNSLSLPPASELDGNPWGRALTSDAQQETVRADVEPISPLPLDPAIATPVHKPAVSNIKNVQPPAPSGNTDPLGVGFL